VVVVVISTACSLNLIFKVYITLECCTHRSLIVFSSSSTSTILISLLVNKDATRKHKIKGTHMQ